MLPHRCRGHARRARRLGADDPNLRRTLLQPSGDSGDESPTADRHDDRGDLLGLLGDLHRDGALTGDRSSIVKWVDVDGPTLRAVGKRGRAGLVVGASDRDQLDPASANRSYALALLAWGIRRDKDPTFDLKSSASKGEALSMVARARTHDS